MILMDTDFMDMSNIVGMHSTGVHYIHRCRVNIAFYGQTHRVLPELMNSTTKYSLNWTTRHLKNPVGIC